MTFYLITTDHLKSSIWFRDEEDFKAAMNVIPILAALAGVHIIAFILMSNHVHFVVEGTYEHALKFITALKQHHAYYLNLKYKIKEALKENNVDIRELHLSRVELERAIAYVQMNPVAAGICISPSDYPWGTGNSFFKITRLKGIPVESLSKRTRYRLLHCKKEVPPRLLLGEDDYILPESYVQTQFVENLYRNPNRMAHFLRHSSKAKKRLDAGDSEVPVFNDYVILPIVKELCRSLFIKGSIKELSSNELSELMRQLRYRFSSNVNQLSRVTGIPYDKVIELLESI